MHQTGDKRDRGFSQRLRQLLSACWILSITAAACAQTQLPSDFGPERYRLVSSKSWAVGGLRYIANEGYQWLPDGRIFVWIGNDAEWQAILVDTKTGTQQALPLFNALYKKAYPPRMAENYNYVAPDGKSIGSLLSAFSPSSPPTVEFYRTLSLDGGRVL